MKTTDLIPGDIIAISSSKWLARQIQKFMKLQARIKYGEQFPVYFNHTFTVVNAEDLIIAEAIKKGFSVHNIWEQYNKKDLSRMVVFRLKNPLTKADQNNLNDQVKKMAFENIEYEVLNFFWWIPYILSNGKIDFSPKTSKQAKRVFCFKTSAMLLEAARFESFPNPDKVTTVDLMMDNRFEQLYFS